MIFTRSTIGYRAQPSDELGASMPVKQLLLSPLAGIGLPLAIYAALNAEGHSATRAVYILALVSVVLDLLVTCLAGLTLRRRPLWSDPDHPSASAIVLTDPDSVPAEVAATTQALLRQAYRSPVQVAVACCTEEQENAIEYLRRLHGPQLLVCRTPHPTPTSQVQTVLPLVTGQIVGIFRPGRQPFRDAFVRAWFWLQRGCTAVDGGYLTQTMDRLARLQAVEQAGAGITPPPVYTPDHIWSGCLQGATFVRTGLLWRLVGSGALRDCDVSDPALDTWPARLQRHLQREIDLHCTEIREPGRNITRDRGPRRWRLRMDVALGWHTAHAWLSAQVPVAAILLVWSAGPAHPLEWLASLLPLLLLSLVGANAMRAGFVFILAPPELARHPRWFVEYALLSAAGYRGLGQAVTRAAQIRLLTARRVARARLPAPVRSVVLPAPLDFALERETVPAFSPAVFPGIEQAEPSTEMAGDREIPARAEIVSIGLAAPSRDGWEQAHVPG